MSVKSPKRLPPEPELGSPRAVKLLQENPENEGELTEWLQSAHQEQCSIQQDVILSPKSTAADKARLELFQGQIAELDAQINLNRQRLKELRITAQLTPSEHILLKLISADAASMSEDQQLQLLEIKVLNCLCSLLSIMVACTADQSRAGETRDNHGSTKGRTQDSGRGAE